MNGNRYADRIYFAYNGSICYIALMKLSLSSILILGDIDISGILIKDDELANTLGVCLYSGAIKVLLHLISEVDLGTVH